MNQPKQVFKNSVRVLLPESLIIGRKDLFNSFVAIIGEQSKNISYISQFNANNNWIVTFNENFKAESIFGKCLNFQGISVRISDPAESQNPYRFAQYRVHWLPHAFEKSKVKSFMLSLTKYIEVTAIDEEFCREEGMTTIKNGNFRVKIRYLKKDEASINIQTGLHKLDSFKALLTKIGERPKCLLCNKEGHIKRECELANVKCNKCLKIGHDTVNCNYANQLTSQKMSEMIHLPNEDADSDEEVYPKDQNDQILTSDVKASEEKKRERSEINPNDLTQTIENPKDKTIIKSNNNPNPCFNKAIIKPSTLPTPQIHTSTPTTTATTSNKRSNSQISPANDNRRKKNHHHPCQGEVSESQKL